MERQSPNTTLERILQTGAAKPRPVSEVRCPVCGKSGIRSGSRNTKRGRIPRLYCRPCRRSFCASPVPRKHYSAATVLEAVTAYNFGRTLADTQRHIARRFRKTVLTSTIHSWLGHFASLCTFSRYRKRFTFSEEDVIRSRTFSHRQEYKFRLHRLKANILTKALFMTVWRPSTRSAENSCGMRQG